MKRAAVEGKWAFAIKVVDQLGAIIKTAIKYGSVVATAYFVADAVHALAGQKTRYNRGIPASGGSVGRHGSEEELNVAAAAPSLSPGSYTWTFPGCPIQIRLQLELVAALQRLVEWAEDAGMPAPFCGGLLLGDIASPAVTVVADMEPLPALDTATVEAAIRRAEGEVVGFFRAVSGNSLQAGVSLRLTDDDAALAAGLFHQPSSVVLLIETAEAASAKAAFFFWHGGKMLGDFSIMDCPFDSHQLAALERQRTLRAPPESRAATPGREHLRP